VAEKVVVVAHTGDIGVARQIARQMALELGASATTGEEIAVAASELASNLVKHARGGRMHFAPLDKDGNVGIMIESRDDGAGIAQVEQALADGYSTAGSLGYGLGTVNRLMDTLDITSRPGAGAHIVCIRWLRSIAPRAEFCPLEFGIATRPMPGMTVNGDSFIIKRWGTSVLVGVIDGLGHGPHAHLAAETARQYVETHYDQPLIAIFSGVGRACYATRGVVMALARFDFSAPGTAPQTGAGAESHATTTLTFASIGNVEARVHGTPAPLNLLLRRGVLGGSAPNAPVTTHPWAREAVMVLHSDGLTTRWRWEDFPDLSTLGAADAAARLLRKLAKEEDDATVLVVMPRGNP
jgi:anti-sigma regulatory factor (Ser/Thr protein kinase)